ncbi:MAG TPA: hypothetical protein VIL49_03640 [Capillimicrobium sp.]|jgi:hypothetical protein
MAKRPKQHGYAAFAPDDVGDARRGRPSSDLRPYAEARGLEWMDRARPGGYSAAVSSFEEYRFNVMRGTLPGGRYGALLHQLLEVPITGSPNISGKLYGVVAKTPGRWWMPSLPTRQDIPIIGDFLNPAVDHTPHEAFDTHSVWIPTTMVAINVPEAALPLFLVRIDRRDKHNPYDFEHRRDLGADGLPGWRLRSHGEPVDDGLLGRLLTPSVRAIFERHADDPYFGVIFLRGTMLVRRNGFIDDHAALDALATDASTLADAARAACLHDLRPQPFSQPLPAPHSEHPEVVPGWSDGYRKLADRLGLTLEDADDYHRAFPSIGVPGRAVAVMRGDLDGVQGRLVYSAELHLQRAERARGAVLLPAPPGLPETPPGGHRRTDVNLVHEQRGDVTVLWSLVTAGFFPEEQEGLIERAVAFARANGLVAA